MSKTSQIANIANIANIAKYQNCPIMRLELQTAHHRYSVLPALTTQGIIALDIFEGSVTKDRFLAFIREQVVSHHL
jgi:hypothetical protein